MEESPVARFWKELFGRYKNPRECNLLEVGCGKGELGPILSGKVVKEYFGIDPRENEIEYAKTKIKGKRSIEYKVGRAEQIPFKKKFDIIFYTFSWHFIKNFKEALKEDLRVLTDDGIVVILEPNEKTDLWKSPTLIRGSPEFSETEHRKKLQDLQRAKKEIYEQNDFSILEERIGDESNPNIWVLKRKH